MDISSFSFLPREEKGKEKEKEGLLVFLLSSDHLYLRTRPKIQQTNKITPMYQQKIWKKITLLSRFFVKYKCFLVYIGESGPMHPWETELASCPLAEVEGGRRSSWWFPQEGWKEAECNSATRKEEGDLPSLQPQSHID